MKFTVAALFTLALALGVQSSVVPVLAGHHLSYTAVGPSWAGPWGHGVVAAGPHPSVAVHAATLSAPAPSVAVHAATLSAPAPSVAVHAATWSAPAPSVAVHAAPLPALHAVHAPVHGVHAPVHAPLVLPAVQGSYIAKTRGAVHSAPLAGHASSVANVNLAAAPGTV
ncbi:adult cuticle protein 1-like [Musca vetustissima]|uniref:adult cuticle protein 1-like n=1 Tax=Musca vetustissima TaxID=27455 RepID=UPI002AB64DF8|nr:adult cuticle protein 1-like [Musca vetustissima]